MRGPVGTLSLPPTPGGRHPPSSFCRPASQTSHGWDPDHSPRGGAWILTQERGKQGALLVLAAEREEEKAEPEKSVESAPCGRRGSWQSPDWTFRGALVLSEEPQYLLVSLGKNPEGSGSMLGALPSDQPDPHSPGDSLEQEQGCPAPKAGQACLGTKEGCCTQNTKDHAGERAPFHLGCFSAEGS